MKPFQVVFVLLSKSISKYTQKRQKYRRSNFGER